MDAMDNYTGTVPSPGHFIKEELDARGWTQSDLAFILGCPVQAVNLIVAGKRGISPEMSKALGVAFDVSAEFFVNLQRIYDLSKARDPDPNVARRARFLTAFPIREMIKRGWIEYTDDPALLELQMMRFFDAKSADDIPHLPHAAKKTHYDDMPPPQVAWLFRVRQIAGSITTPPYSGKALRNSLPRLHQLLGDPEETRHVSRILSECGVRFVVVEPLPKGKIDGVCFWLDPNSPVIGMSLRFDRIDNFWFVLRHEIEHVLRRHGRHTEMVDVDLVGPRSMRDEQSSSIEERDADNAAAEFTIPQAEIADFIARKNPFFSERDVLGFARRLGIHPGLVVGQIQSQTARYDFLRRYLVKIRQFVLPGAIADGWGCVFPVAL
jgi:HTH-type transcriptional regulator / antitoxin HigA